MKISEINDRVKSDISIKALVLNKSDVREVYTKYGKSNVCDCLIEDETEQIKLYLWNNDIERIGIGDLIEIEGAFVTTFRNERVLNAPIKTGSIKKISL